jgi:hypothetical protein
MAWEKCETCNGEFFQRSKETNCPECENSVKGSKMEGTPLEKVESKVERGSKLAAKATQNANVLDRFGNVLQVIGYAFMAIFVCGAVVGLFASQWLLFGVSLLFIPVAFVNFNVFGSVFRAIGSYIQYKVN